MYCRKLLFAATLYTLIYVSGGIRFHSIFTLLPVRCGVLNAFALCQGKVSSLRAIFRSLSGKISLVIRLGTHVSLMYAVCGVLTREA